MEKPQFSLEQLNLILEHLHQPRELDQHPWVESRLALVQPGTSPGEKLVRAIRQVFRELKPAYPPRQGKRLDTRWGVFGLLAAQYFAPLDFGLPVPRSQREAWLGIDQAILLYTFGPGAEPDAEMRQQYCLVGNEPEIAPNSTLSGWNRKGREAFLRSVIRREAELEAGLFVNTPVEGIRSAAPNLPARRPYSLLWKRVSLILGLMLLGLTFWTGWRGYQLYQQVQVVLQDLSALKPLLSPNPRVGQIPELAAQVSRLRADLNTLQTETAPFSWLAPGLGWVPQLGGDLSQAPELVELAVSLSTAADEGLQAILPAAKVALEKDQPLDMLAVLNQLQQNQSRLLAAQVALAQAQTVRQQINVDLLSARPRILLTEQVDPLLQAVQGKFRMEDALLLVKAAPSMLGVGKAGPKTYLLLIQNEDELRPTGGFITAVGSVVIRDSQVWDLHSEAVEMVDDFEKPYPQAPWQLDELMGLPILTLRDSNWSTDFPTAAALAEYFYSYTRAHTVDGVIAIDQHVVIELLKILGPVHVEGTLTAITGENVQQYMRTSKEHAPPGTIGLWDRKQFIGRLAQPLLEKLLGARGGELSALSQTLVDLLDQRHILLQFDDPDLTAFLARRRWDGAVRAPVKSDFLMVVDTNMSYNKSNAVLKTALTYEVDLSSLAQPVSRLTVQHTNHATSTIPCILYLPRSEATRDYPIDECHWTYLRVYTPAGTKLLGASPHAIPAEQTMAGIAIPPRVDDLGNEDLPGIQAFGTLVVIPQRQTVQTGFEFGLPGAVLQTEAKGIWTYRLTIQKQPGIQTVPLTLRLSLPAAAKLLSGPQDLLPGDGFWSYTTTLTEDAVLEITFSVED